MRDMLAVRNLSFAHDAKKLFVNASLTIDDGQRVALLGKNGAGKSTLLSILAGELAPDDGGVERGRGQTIGLLAQTPRIDENARVVDVARAALAAVTRPGEELGEQRVEEVLTRLGVKQREEPVRQLSGGGRRRLDVARLLLQEPDVLLLDEPTNHLDVEGMAFLVEELKRHRGVVLFVSHDRAFVDDVATKIVELEDGQLIPYPVPTAAYLEQKLLREEHLARTAHRQRRLYVRELAWLRAGTPARTTKQQARIQRAEELADEVEAQAQKLREHKAKVLIEGAAARRLGKSILDMKGLVLKRGERTLVGGPDGKSGLDLALVPGDRWGIVGENGAGKTTLLNAILTQAGLVDGADAVQPAAGTLTLGRNTTIAIFDQHRAELDPGATLEETLAGANDHVSVGEKRVHIATYLEQFLFDGADRYRRVKTLSGGQQNRLVLARLFQKDANLLLLDEPTNDLDVETLGVLEDTLLQHAGVALIVSHDRRFLDRVATGILAFEGDGKVVPVPGDWTNYSRLKAQAASTERSPTTAAPGSTSDEKKKDAPSGPRKKRSYKEEQELKGMEEKILTAEARKEELQSTLNAGEIFRTDPAQAKAMTEELSRVEGEIERMYARWQELEQLLPM
jgi:ATP-binding cassette subfamily F protein uup